MTNRKERISPALTKVQCRAENDNHILLPLQLSYTLSLIFILIAIPDGIHNHS